MMNGVKPRIIDLRSDTITQPTSAMREAMACAVVGDDVFGDDPTVRCLEERVASLLGKEASLFVPSGTMANQLALRIHTEPGDEVLVEANAHIYYYESGAPAALSGVTCRCLPGVRGIFSRDDVLAALRPRDQHFPVTRLVCVENTHNRGGGSVWTLDEVRHVAEAARAHGLRLHLDGARLWNAAVAAGHTEEAYAAWFDTVSVCFSKGLGAPVGSVLAGPRDLIQRARRFRKLFGGAMRQSGILAAAALYALDHHRARLAVDHANARLLAQCLSDIPELEVDVATVQTNMVLVGVRGRNAEPLARALEAAGVRTLAVGPHTLRMVTSLMVTAEDVQEASARIARVVQAGPWGKD